MSNERHIHERLVMEDLGDRVVLRLNRPEARNAIDLPMVAALHEACAGLEENPRPAILIGSGGVFAAGADIAQLRERRRADALRGVNSTIFDRLHRLPMPVVGCLEGYALGGGAELAYACDFRVATPDLHLGNPEPALGIVAAAGACWRLKELVGEPVAKEILLAGRVLTADEAHEMRLVNEVVQPDDLLAAGHRWVDRIVKNAPLAVQLTKAVFHAPRDAHPMVDNIAQAILFETEEKQTRMTAFLERRTK